jgi:HSP20 family protein
MARRRTVHAVIAVSHGLDEVLDEFFGPDQTGAVWEPRIELFSDNVSVYILAELPGVTPDNLSLTVASRWVYMRGEKPVPEQVRRGVSFYEAEIPYGPFEKRVSLPFPVDTDSVAVDLTHGVLSIRLNRAGRLPRMVKVE